jgi:hypothetical protein
MRPQTKERPCGARGNGKTGVMRPSTFLLACACLLSGLGEATAATDPKLLVIEQKMKGFSDADYATSVDRILAAFEADTGIGLKPGQLRKCGLKVSSESGQGLSTPKPLVRALGAALMRRGFAQDAIVLCDVRQQSLQQCGFLPALSTEAQAFEGFPVIAYEPNAKGWAEDKKLRYENQIMPRPGSPTPPWGDARVSVLPKTLFDDVDFWINLPVLSDSKSLGVHGALAAASLGNMANAERFLDNPFNASKAAVEVCAIPGLAKKNVLTILSLEHYQILGGPSYDANWCASEKTVLASANPVILDYIGLQKINAGRTARAVEVIRPEPPIFSAANAGEIRLGTCRPSEIKLVRLPAE